MQFEKGYIYHIYNQGNNRRKIFFNRENYLFFLKKMRTYILPYGDILAWCLMPNHFHFMVYVKEIEVGLESESIGVVLNNADAKNTANTKQRTFNQSIGIMLRSYSQALNRQQKFSGKLIREKTKAECINCPHGITPDFFSENGITLMENKGAENQYPQICFNYIHQNPVKANLVKTETDWEFSSAKDYSGQRNGTLINKQTAQFYVEIN